MIRTALACLVVASFLLPGAARAADDGLLGRFYTDWEVLYIERDRTPDTTISWLDPSYDNSNDVFGPKYRQAIGTDDVVDDDEEFGGRGLLGFRLNDTSAVEIVFLGVGHERSATKRSAPEEDLYAFEGPDIKNGSLGHIDDNSLDPGALHDLDYDSDFYSGELNFRHRYELDGADYHFNLLAGLRALRLEEDLSLTGIDDATSSGRILNGGERGVYTVDVQNTLIGAQLGVETFVPLLEDRLDFDLYTVAGGYANRADSQWTFTDEINLDPPDSIDSSSRSEWDVAGVFEAAAHFHVRVWGDVRLKLGYRAIYLINIAAAPDQFPQSGAKGDFFGNAYDNDGQTLFHGPSLGLALDF